MKAMTFHLNGDPDKTISFTATRLINAGYTGRNQESVKAHIEELKAMGIPAPEAVPCFFPKDPERLEFGDKLRVLDEDCSGEAEFVLLRHGGRYYFGCGSDVFDKQVEAIGNAKAKHLYANQISRDLWLLDEIAGHFDTIILRSWIDDSPKRLYQEGSLAKILQPQDLISRMVLAGEPEPGEGFVLFSGTLPCLIEGMPYTSRFTVELEDPVLGRSLRCSYGLEII